MNRREVVSGEELQSILALLKLNDLYKRDHINQDKLSEGEKARINLAQAVLRKPDVLLIDETLSSVDIEFEKEIIKNIILKNPKMSVVCITHRLAIQELFQQTIVIKGRTI